MAPSLFRLLLAFVAIYALWRGSRDERHVALICIVGAVVTTLVLPPLGQRFQGVERPVVLVDVGVFLAFLVVALRSERFWPLWVAGLQLTTIMGHALKGIDASLFPRAYAAALNFWAYPIVIVLAIGTWRTHQRRIHAERHQPA